MAKRNARSYGIKEGTLPSKIMGEILKEEYEKLEDCLNSADSVKAIVKQCYLMAGFPIWSASATLIKNLAGNYIWDIKLDIDTGG